MNFNSYIFVIFFLVVYALYLLFKRRYRVQNLILLIASYTFYGWWDWRFLFLLLTTTAIDYWVSNQIYRSEDAQKRKKLLFLSIVTNLTILGFFKYFNFFADSFTKLFNLIGLNPDPISLSIVLPVGISFYTFQSMSYTIDVYRKDLVPANNFFTYALYLSFFPQLVAGPIERAITLLPQVKAPRTIDINQVNAGLFLILWGYFKKVVVADNVAQLANQVYNNYSQYQGLDVWIGILAFTIQIYCDFSAYSDIARGLAKLMGFDLMLNFRLPYFALSPSDFWSRWHISLSTWLRDYLYIPLGGNRHGDWNTYRNLMLTMLLGGLWHGASWTFVLWGGFQGSILILYRALGALSKKLGVFRSWVESPSNWQVLTQWGLMFILTNIGWVIFRSKTVEQMVYMLTQGGFSSSLETGELGYRLLFFSLPLIAVQIYQHFTRDLLILAKLNSWFQIPVYSLMLIWMSIFGVRQSTEFIYFQF